VSGDRDLLRETWLAVRHRPGWLARMVDGLGLDGEAEAYLTALDESLLTLRKMEYAMAEVARNKVMEYRVEVQSEEAEYVRESRRGYLLAKSCGLRSYLSDVRLIWGRSVSRSKTKARGQMAAAMGKNEALERLLSRCERELSDLRRPIVRGISDDQVQRARDYPLWKLLELRPGARVKCQWHEDKKKTMALYPNGRGHCFSCNKTYDAIAWVMRTQGVDFLTAVQRLA
jgi:hypothetical protein